MGDFKSRPEGPEYGQILAEIGTATLVDALIAEAGPSLLPQTYPMRMMSGALSR